MTSAVSAVEAAAYTALAAGVTLGDVYQHVPHSAQTPLVIIADMDAEPFGTKGDDPDRKVSLRITSIVEGTARKPLLDLQAEVETALDGLSTTVPGWSLTFTFQSSDGFLLEEGVSEKAASGQTYVGNSLFNVMAISS